jgi:hypothetical protein
MQLIGVDHREEVVHTVEAATVVEAAIMVAIAIMAVDIMAGTVITADIAITAEAAGMEPFGSDPDGADGGHGGGLLIIRAIIHTIRKHRWSSRSSPRYMSSQRNRIIGITAKIPRGTIPISKSVLVAG